MDELEYKKRLEIIEKNHEMEKRKLYYEYGISNAKYKVGDLIKDHRWAFVVDKITVSKMLGMPEPVYHGFELKKDFTIRKDKNYASIYGNNCELIRAAGEKV